MSIDDCVNEFASSAVAQHDAIWLDADARKADQLVDKVNRAFEFLRLQGDVGRDALMRLFFDSRPEVRVSAAAYLLRHCTPEALAVLKREAAGAGMPAFQASQAIERWKDGTWSLDPL